MSFFYAGAAFHFGVASLPGIMRQFLDFIEHELRLECTRISVSIQTLDTYGRQAWSEAGLHDTAFHIVPAAQTMFRLPESTPKEIRHLSGIIYELYYPLSSVPCNNPACSPACQCGKYVEFGNVIIFGGHPGTGQLYHAVEGVIGFERVLLLRHNLLSILDTQPVRVARIALQHHAELPDSADDPGVGVAADSLRALTAVSAAGARPGPKGRGNVVRRLYRNICHLVRARRGHLGGVPAAMLELVSQSPFIGTSDDCADGIRGFPFDRERELFEAACAGGSADQ